MFIGFGASAQVYQNMAQPGYKFGRARFDSVLTIPTGLGAMRNITGGQDTGQIRFNVSDSSVYVWNGRRWIKAGGGTIPTLTQVLESAVGANEAGANQIKDLSAGTSQNDAATFGQLTDTANLRLRISDTSAMLRRYLDTLQAHNTRIISAGGGGGSTGWALTGNASSVTDFLGTTNNRTMRFRTNNVERMVIDSIGNVGIGISNPNDIFHLRKDQVTTNTQTTTSVLLTNANANGISAFGFTSDGTTRQGGFQYNNQSGFRNIFSTSYTDIPYYFGSNSLIRMTIGAGVNAGNIGIGIITPTAKLNIAAGTVTAGTAPLKFTAGTKLTTPEAGAIEYVTGNVVLQNDGITLGANTAAASAKLDVQSTTQGILIPRMTLTQRNAIASPAAGLQVIVTGETGGEFVSMYNSSLAAWVNVNGWGLSGNASAVTDFLGTTNNRTLRFRTNNVERLVIDSIGRIRPVNNTLYSVDGIYGMSTFTNGTTFFGLNNGSGVQGIYINQANANGRILRIDRNESPIFQILETNVLGINMPASIGALSPNSSAQLDIQSTTKGVLFPRMTTVQKLAIGSPAAGLQVYDTTLNQMSYYNGTTWVNF